jgi:hypothetical protein
MTKYLDGKMAALVICLLFLLQIAPGQAADGQFRQLDTRAQKLKMRVLDLNRELFLLEEELLYPGSTQTAVFVSMDVGKFFALDSVQLKIDDKVVANYLYTEREVAALFRGGVQRLYTGNLKAGQHELVAIFIGKGPKGRDYRRGTSLKFMKGTGEKFIELKIVDDKAKLQPKFSVKEWE